MSVGLFILAAVLLSVERICYVYIWHFPDSFRAFCDRLPWAFLGEPVDVLEKLFYGFKLIQFIVFFGWIYFHGNGSILPLSGGIFSLAAGGALIAVGQILNFSVFYRLGRVGVFYGNKFGYETPWCRAFPFSFLNHPQYVGTLLSIWGFFLVMRFPHDDWYILPILETVYYLLGGYFEQPNGHMRNINAFFRVIADWLSSVTPIFRSRRDPHSVRRR